MAMERVIPILNSPVESYTMSFEAALRALVREEVEAALSAQKSAAIPAKPGKKAATESAAPAVAQPQAAMAPAPQPVQPPDAPAAPTISKDKLNKAVLAVAGVNREGAIKILAKHGVTNTATLPVEKYQAVFDDFEEEKARLDAASAQASLV